MKARFLASTLVLSALCVPASAQQIQPEPTTGWPADFAGPPDSGAGAELARCEQGDADACYALGNRYHGGDGVPRDNHHSVRLIRQACELGAADACYDLGIRHLLGEYAEQSATMAVERLQQACENEYAVSCFVLASLARDGVGLSQASTLADQLFDRACELHYTPACGQSGVVSAGVYESGLPSGASAEALDDARACDRRVMASCHALALRYADGELPDEHGHTAHTLFDRACDWGFLPSCDALRARGDR